MSVPVGHGGLVRRAMPWGKKVAPARIPAGREPLMRTQLALRNTAHQKVWHDPGGIMMAAKRWETAPLLAWREHVTARLRT